MSAAGWERVDDAWHHCDRLGWIDDEGVTCSRCQSTMSWDDESAAVGNVSCPVCGSVEVTGGFVEVLDDTAWQSVSCDDCGSSWDDVYVLTRRENVRRGDRVEIATARQSVGVADWLDMAYEDRTACDDMGGVL